MFVQTLGKMLKTKKSIIKRIILFIVIAIAILIFSAMAFISFSYITTPLDKTRLAYSNLGVEIYDSATYTTPIYYSSDKKLISSSYLQPHTLNAFISIEDKRFYKHNGYDLKRIIKASVINLKRGSKSQGASTITQQLVKNILLNSDKTYSRKFKEIMLAIKTEKNFTKDEILNMYLNSIYFGSNAYGIESASNLYFNKSASELDINESAILAGIIKSPVYYSPINYPDNCFKRKNIVLEQMYNNGYITLDEYNQNKLKPIEVDFKKNNYDNSYNQQAILEACDLLGISEKELLRQGLKIYTYLDNTIQQSVEKALYESDFNQDKLSIVADNTGKVLAYCGDSYFDLSNMKRNPASTIKPLVVYLPAISSNIISPATPILDEAIQSGYSPKNAGDKYMGWISARDALAHSSNVCAVKLLNEIGLDLANDYGYKLNLFNTYQSNPSLALGDVGGGVSVVNLARAYSVLQNNGIDKGLTFISKIETKDGKVLYQDKYYSNQLFTKEDCMLINDMLKTCALSGTAKRLSDLNFEVASKTGTAQIDGKNTDLWNIAYTSEHLTLTWCGDATSKGLESNFSSSFYPTMINKSILKSIYSAHTPQPFKLNENIVKIALDSIEYNNLHKVALAPSNAPERYKLYELFKSDNVPIDEATTYSSPEFGFSVELTTKGAKISLNYSPIYTYKVFALSNGQSRLVGTYNNDILYDDKVFSYTLVDYYVIATNNYTNNQYTSDNVVITPQEYLVDILNNNFISQNRQTKNKWYV